MSDDPGAIRLDKWLWASRFFKTRALAKSAIEQGKIRSQGQKCKASRLVRSGDNLSIEKAGELYEVEVLGGSERRVSAKEAVHFYREEEASVQKRAELREMKKLAALASPRPIGRPDKKQRRNLRSFKRS